MNIEPLESRIAPAAVFKFTDVDGDLVTVITSKGTNTQLETIITAAPEGLGLEMQAIDLGRFGTTFAGTNLTVSAKRTSIGGDGLVNVGFVDVTDLNGGVALDIGVVKIKGDLGRIDAGDADRTTTALKGLSVRSMGRFGTSTQAAGAFIQSSINGGLGFLKVAGDVKDAALAVMGFSDGKIGSMTIGGSLIGGSDNITGVIFATGAIGPVKIGGNIQGGGKLLSGAIQAEGALGSVSVGGSIFGGEGRLSGSVTSGGAMGAVKIGGSIEGGGGTNSGRLSSTGAMGAVKIGGNLKGGDVTAATSVNGSGSIQAARLASLRVGGSIIAGAESGGGTLSDSGAVRVTNDIGPITIKGSLIGNATNPVLITAGGQATPGATTDLAVKSLTVTSRVEFADILAGYDTSNLPAGVNADAQIGAVMVGGDWIASNLIAGVQDDASAARDAFFGDGDDQKIIGGIDTAVRVSKIASILIKGQALGTVSAGDHFGFVAQEIGSFQISVTAFPLVPGPASPLDLTGYAVGITGDLRVREVFIEK